MEQIRIYLEQLIAWCGIEGVAVGYIRYVVLIGLAVLLAWFSGWLCRRMIPWIERLTTRTETGWDDVLLGRPVLRSASFVVPAVVIWLLLPWVFFDHAAVHEVLARLTAIYITVMMTKTLVVLIDSLKLLEGDKRTARQQYLYSFCGVLKIILMFIAVIVVISIAIDKSPATLLAGLGAASAVTMLVFQDTIKGLVAGIRLTSNDMLHKGDWITVPSAGANGTVEEITLTTVKVRNFDNTIVTVTPQTLVDGSFQNWEGMRQGDGRKVARTVYFDFSSLSLDDEGTANITRFRRHVEEWLSQQPTVNADMLILARQQEATQAGMAVEFIFWTREKGGAPYEHAIADIMEYIYAAAPQYGLRIYQRN